MKNFQLMDFKLRNIEASIVPMKIVLSLLLFSNNLEINTEIWPGLIDLKAITILLFYSPKLWKMMTKTEQPSAIVSMIA